MHALQVSRLGRDGFTSVDGCHSHSGGHRNGVLAGRCRVSANGRVGWLKSAKLWLAFPTHPSAKRDVRVPAPASQQTTKSPAKCRSLIKALILPEKTTKQPRDAEEGCYTSSGVVAYFMSVFPVP
eukprot:TRINITY_DN41810_c0_g1_i1.p1 TRINITY_DN41810_c0_g1~~TRINITY_DN41810_c0_g1_i1.p1  ORF type:complete len:125 (+),score=0.62 TRINITY_DN41810_c0_g1_i1:26-400(+)